jgi:hypothetical protein
LRVSTFDLRAFWVSAHRHRTGETLGATVVDPSSAGRNWEFQSEHVALYIL